MKSSRMIRLCPQWEEASSRDDQQNTVRTYEICTITSTSSYWLRTRWIPLKAATTVYVEIWLVEITGRLMLINAEKRI